MMRKCWFGWFRLIYEAINLFISPQLGKFERTTLEDKRMLLSVESIDPLESKSGGGRNIIKDSMARMEPTAEPKASIQTF